MAGHRRLFEPLVIGSVSIKNRIAFAPLATGGLLTSAGALNQRGFDYYAERIKGGAGLIIVGVTKVENEVERLPVGSAGRLQLTDYALPALGEIAELAHAFGARVIVQLTPGDGRNSPMMQIVGPSEIPSKFHPNVTAKELTVEEIARIVEAHGRASAMLKRVGVDGVEINGHEGYLADEFTMSLWNKRTDRYGGSLEGRLTFAKELLESIRAAAGNDFPVVYRFGMKHYMKAPHMSGLPGEDFIEVGRDIEEGKEVAKLLQQMGYDALDVDAGCYDAMYWAHPPIYQPHGCLVPLAAEAKRVVDIPVLVAGRLDLPDQAEDVIASGKADMISLGRALLADPEWPNKVRTGRVEDIRPCIACHRCLQRHIIGKPLSCAVNPVSGREKLFDLSPAAEAKKVLVVGGGVAGMEAARVLKIRGHEVTLREKSHTLGGHLAEAGAPDFKADIGRLNDWYVRQMKVLDVPVEYGATVDAAAIVGSAYDAVIVATGSDAAGLDAAGAAEFPNKVLKNADVLLGRVDPGENVVIVGCGVVGLETALWLADKGKKVTGIEVLPQIAGDASVGNRDMLLDLVKNKGIAVMTGSRVARVTEKGVEVVDASGSEAVLVPCDSVVVAIGFTPTDALYRSLLALETGLEVYNVGDSLQTGEIMSAIWSAYTVARAI
jgi:2-enoate reductase